MPKTKTFPLAFWTAVTILVSLNIIVFSVMIITATNDLKVQYIPDDAFYYLTLSRNFSSFGMWTFDSGTSITSGFHPLFAYFLLSIFSFSPLNENSFLISGIVLSMLFALASIIILWIWGFKQKNILFLAFLVLVISKRNFVYNTVSVTEWSLTVLISSLYCVWFFTKYRPSTTRFVNFLVLFTLGLLGSIARSDFGLLPFSIVVATLVLSFFITRPNKQLLFAFIGLLGTLIGLLVVLGHNQIFTNEILQSSAKMKAYWAQVGASNLNAALFLYGRIIGETGLSLLALLVIIAVLPIFIKKEGGHLRINNHAISLHSKQYIQEARRFLSSNNRHSAIAMLISAVVCILGYTWFYSRNAAIQPWYTANLIVPILMLIFGISEFITVSLHEKTRFFFFILILSSVVLNISNLYPISTANAPWPHQEFMLDAGVYLKENSPNSRIGAWNAGIIGYYEGGNVVNLDGLVNNDIYEYAINNNLPAYLSSMKINYIVDFENMITDKTLRVRGGYDDFEFIGNLKPQKVFDEGPYPWRYLTLYHIDKINALD